MALITVYTAEPGKGKTQAALTRIGRAKAVFFCPTPLDKNKLLNRLDFIYARELLLLKPDELASFQKRFPQFRCILGYDEAHLLQDFMGEEWAGYVFVLNDLPQLVPQQKDFQYVVQFIAGIRHRDCTVMITTQRVLGVTPPYVRVIADEILQVGPLVAQDEARTLYMMGGSSKYPLFKDFYAAISKNPPYSIFVVKGLDTPSAA